MYMNKPAAMLWPALLYIYHAEVGQLAGQEAAELLQRVLCEHLDVVAGDGHLRRIWFRGLAAQGAAAGEPPEGTRFSHYRLLGFRVQGSAHGPPPTTPPTTPTPAHLEPVVQRHELEQQELGRWQQRSVGQRLAQGLRLGHRGVRQALPVLGPR